MYSTESPHYAETELVGAMLLFVSIGSSFANIAIHLLGMYIVYWQDISKTISYFFSCVTRKPDFSKTRLFQNKGGHRAADKRLCLRYIDSTIPLLPKSETSSI